MTFEPASIYLPTDSQGLSEALRRFLPLTTELKVKGSLHFQMLCETFLHEACTDGRWRKLHTSQTGLVGPSPLGCLRGLCGEEEQFPG